MTEILIKAKTMHAAMAANIAKGDPKSDNIKGLTEVSGIISYLISTIESLQEQKESQRIDFLALHDDFLKQKEEIGRMYAVNQHLEIEMAEQSGKLDLVVKALGECQIALKWGAYHHLRNCTCAECNALGTVEYTLEQIGKVSNG